MVLSFQALYCPLVAALIITTRNWNWVHQKKPVLCLTHHPPLSSPLVLIPKHLWASEKRSEETLWSSISRIDSDDSDCGNEPAAPLSGAREVTGESRANAYKARADPSMRVGVFKCIQEHALSAGGCSLNKQQKNCRSFVSRLLEWKLLRSTAAVPRNASAQNKWRQKLSAINTYWRPKTHSNYQRSLLLLINTLCCPCTGLFFHQALIDCRILLKCIINLYLFCAEGHWSMEITFLCWLNWIVLPATARAM